MSKKSAKFELNCFEWLFFFLLGDASFRMVNTILLRLEFLPELMVELVIPCADFVSPAAVIQVTPGPVSRVLSGSSSRSAITR